MLSIWKFLLLHFRPTGHTNYAFESVNLVAQASSLLSEWNAHQLKWCHFVNHRGDPGHIISCDLAMEHWNHAYKQHLHTAGVMSARPPSHPQAWPCLLSNAYVPDTTWQQVSNQQLQSMLQRVRKKTRTPFWMHCIRSIRCSRQREGT